MRPPAAVHRCTRRLPCSPAGAARRSRTATPAATARQSRGGTPAATVRRSRGATSAATARRSRSAAPAPRRGGAGARRRWPWRGKALAGGSWFMALFAMGLDSLPHGQAVVECEELRPSASERVPRDTAPSRSRRRDEHTRWSRGALARPWRPTREAELQLTARRPGPPSTRRLCHRDRRGPRPMLAKGRILERGARAAAAGLRRLQPAGHSAARELRPWLMAPLGYKGK